jgi:hypothetical protein
VIAEATGSHVVGDPVTVSGLLAQLVASTGADELMVTTSTFAHADRLASYELLAQAASDSGGPGEVGHRASARVAVVSVELPEQIRHAGSTGQTGSPAEGLG